MSNSPVEYDRTVHEANCSFMVPKQDPLTGELRRSAKTLAWYKNFSKVNPPVCPACGVQVDAD